MDFAVSCLKRTLLVLLYFLLGGALFCQPKEVIKKTIDSSFVYTFNLHSDSNYQISNSFIKVLSEYSGLSKEDYEYKISVYTNIKSKNSKQRQIEIDILIDKFEFPSPITFRGFDISPVLIPSLLDVNLQVSNLSKKSYKNFDFKQVSIINLHEPIITLLLPDSIINSDFQISTSHLNFNYNFSNLHAFEERISLINSYYDFEVEINKVLTLIHEMDTGNLDMFPIYELRLKEVQNFICRTKDPDSFSKLNVSRYDPLGLMIKLNEIEKRFAEKSSAIENLISNLDKVYYQKGMAFLNQGNIDFAIANFKRSIQMNPFNIESQYELCLINLNENKLEAAAAIISSILNQSAFDKQINEKLPQLAKLVFEQYIKEVDSLLQNENFSDANQLMAKAKQYCESTPAYPCDNRLNEYLSKGKYGMYNAYLKIAERALETGKLLLSENYIREAENYQKQNHKEIVNNAQGEELLQKLILTYAEKGKTELDRGNYSESLKIMLVGQKICEKYPLIECPEVLLRNIRSAKQSIYNFLIQRADERYEANDPYHAEMFLNQALDYQKASNGDISSTLGLENLIGKINKQIYTQTLKYSKELIFRNKYELAIKHLNEAKEIENSYNLKRNNEIDFLVKQAAKPLILELLNSININVWEKNSVEVESLLQKATEQQKLYFLTEDNDINLKITQIKKLKDDQLCLAAQIECDNYYRQALQNLSFKDYIYIDLLFSKALDVNASNPNCNLFVSNIIELKSRYQNAVNFQKMMISADSALKTADSKSFLSIFEKAENFYTDQNIIKFELEFPSVTTKIISQNNIDFIVSCVEYYISNDKFDNALLLLRNLKSRKYASDKTKNIQMMLGKAIAESDNKLNNDSYPNQKVLEYTSGNNYFKYFKKSYLAARK